MRWIVLFSMVMTLGFFAPALAHPVNCIECHRKNNVSLVIDWNKSSMARSGVNCVDCHGGNHTCQDDSDKAVRPTVQVCKKCHKKQADRFTQGKHALAEKALYIPPMGKKVNKNAPIVFQRSCARCHLSIGEGGGQCDACHAGHRFSAREAQQPEACLPCHSGNHPQYEAFSFSKHGAVYRARGLDDGVPTCATCHMPDGDHMVKTSWGFFGVRGEEPDSDHASFQKPVVQMLEMLGPVLAPDSFRPNMAQWTERREAMLAICSKCHSRSQARKQLQAGDQMVKQANKMAAKFISMSRKLKQRGIYSDKDFFWQMREMHPHRMTMYIDAFHQYPEGSLLEFIYFKKGILKLSKEVKQGVGKGQGTE